MTKQVALTCPACRLEMQIVAEGVPQATEVRCSRCGHSLGLWFDLIDEDEASTREPPANRSGGSGVEEAVVRDQPTDSAPIGLAAAGPAESGLMA